MKILPGGLFCIMGNFRWISHDIKKRGCTGNKTPLKTAEFPGCRRRLCLREKHPVSGFYSNGLVQDFHLLPEMLFFFYSGNYYII